MDIENKMIFTIMDQLCMQVCIIDDDGLLKYYNEPFENNFKFDSSQLESRLVDLLDNSQVKVFPSGDRKRMIDAINEKQFNQEIDLITLGKRLVFLEFSDLNMVAIFLKPFRNCTNLKNALDDVEIKYSLLNQTSEHASAVMEPKTRKFTACNKQMLDLFGLSSQAELEDITVISVSPEYQPDGQLSSEKAKKMMMKVVERGSHDFLWTHLSKQGNEFTTHVHLSAFGPRKEVVFCVFTLSSDEKKVREKEARRTLEMIVEEKTRQLRQLVVELETTQELLVNVGKVEMTNKIVSGIAHELGTPLGTSITAISFLKDKFSILEKLHSEERYNFLDSNILSLKTSLDIIENSVVTAVEKFEFIRETLLARKHIKRSFDLKTMIIGVITSLFQSELDIDKNIDLEKIEKNIIVSDPLIFQSIFTHLIRNSIEHSNLDNDKLLITISMVTDNNVTEITYKDNGVGFDDSLSNSYLNPFVSSKRIKGKMGIGLTLVNNLVTDMNGVINIVHNFKGCKIIIRIPSIAKGGDYVERTQKKN